MDILKVLLFFLPIIFKNKASTTITFADSSNSRVDCLAAVDILHCRFPEYEVDKFVCFERTNKIRLREPKWIVLDGSKKISKIWTGHPVDGVIVAWEVGGAADEVVAGVGHQGRAAIHNASF